MGDGLSSGERLDLVVRGGHLVDPHAGLDGADDVGIRDGRVAVVAPQVPPCPGAEVVDAAGMVVTPGLVDLHVHVYWGVAHLGIEPDPNCVQRGVTTVVDAGSAGAGTYPGFQRYVIEASATRIRAFLHVSSQGQLDPGIGELSDLRFANVRRAQEICERYREHIVGIKVRMSRGLVGDHGREALKRALAVCEATGLPLMLHPNASPLSLEEMLSEMRSGDVLTHCFHAGPSGVLDADGRLRPMVRQAARRGVVFDVGHGAGSFSFEVAQACLAQGFEPGTISSDLHRYNVEGPVYDLATTASKFLLLGWSLPHVVERVTAAPARALGMLGEVGTLQPGACADVALFALREGVHRFADCQGARRTGRQRLVPALTLRAGQRHLPGDHRCPE